MKKNKGIKINISVNQDRALKLGIKNLAQSVIFDYLIDTKWTQKEIVNGESYNWIARNKVMADIPLLEITNTTAIYRHFKKLDELGLIKYIKVGKKDCIKITEKTKSYVFEVDNISTSKSKSNKKAISKSSKSDLIVENNLISESTYTNINKDYKIKETNTKEVVLSEDVERIYNAYPSRCEKKNISTGKSKSALGKPSNQIKSIELLLKHHTLSELENHINNYARDCAKGSKTYLKNFQTFLNEIKKNGIPKEETKAEKKKKLYIWSWYGQAKITGTKEKYEKDKKFYGVGGCDADFITHQTGE